MSVFLGEPEGVDLHTSSKLSLLYSEGPLCRFGLAQKDKSALQRVPNSLSHKKLSFASLIVLTISISTVQQVAGIYKTNWRAKSGPAPSEQVQRVRLKPSPIPRRVLRQWLVHDTNS